MRLVWFGSGGGTRRAQTGVPLAFEVASLNHWIKYVICSQALMVGLQAWLGSPVHHCSCASGPAASGAADAAWELLRHSSWQGAGHRTPTSRKDAGFQLM